MKNKASWKKFVKINSDPYGSTIIKVAVRVMDLLDQDKTKLQKGYYPNMNTAHGLICQADRDVNAGGISGAMAECVAQIIKKYHERGKEFVDSYNN
jgi:hypothetical protein